MSTIICARCNDKRAHHARGLCRRCYQWASETGNVECYTRTTGPDAYEEHEIAYTGGWYVAGGIRRPWVVTR